MTLLGWSNPLPMWIEQAINEGRLTIIRLQHKRYGTYELLQGDEQSPYGHVVGFM